MRVIPDPNARDQQNPWRNIMFAILLEKLSIWFEAAEQRRREDYLAQSSDVVQLEKRIRSLENNGYNF
jgi:hypothetical protein